MKLNTMTFAAAAALCAVGARAQAPGSDQTQAAPAATPAAPAAQAAPMTKEQKKAAWQAKVKAACSVEIADGGVCAGKDFSSGLELCLRENRATGKLTADCKAVVHVHKKKAASGDARTGGEQAAPATTPAPQQ